CIHLNLMIFTKIIRGFISALRSWWDVSENIASGHLVQVLPEYYQPANVWAVYVSRLATSAKVRITVEFLRQYFAEHYPNFSLEHA
ncbi:hypothetical protein HEN98_000005, partial [Escherichia coli]|nr:hypothetical protein [Escherichia coli]